MSSDVCSPRKLQPAKVAELLEEEMSKHSEAELVHVQAKVFEDEEGSDPEDSGLESILYKDD